MLSFMRTQLLSYLSFSFYIPFTKLPFCPVSGPGKEPPDVRCAWGGGGPKGADQGADWAELPVGAGEHPVEDAGQSRADGPVPGPGSDRLPACPSNSCHTGTPKHRHLRPAHFAWFWPFSVARSVQTDRVTDSSFFLLFLFFFLFFWGLLQQKS